MKPPPAPRKPASKPAIKPKNSMVLEEELNDLLSAREYNKWVSKLEGRLRE